MYFVNCEELMKSFKIRSHVENHIKSFSDNVSIVDVRGHVCIFTHIDCQGCGLGLDVSVSRRSRDLSKVSVSSRACRQTSRSRELRSRSWSRSRQFRSRAQVPANRIFLVWKFELHHIETLFFSMKTQSSDQTFKMAAIRWRCVTKCLLKLATLYLHAYSQSQGHD